MRTICSFLVLMVAGTACLADDSVAVASKTLSFKAMVQTLDEQAPDVRAAARKALLTRLQTMQKEYLFKLSKGKKKTFFVEIGDLRVGVLGYKGKFEGKQLQEPYLQPDPQRADLFGQRQAAGSLQTGPTSRQNLAG